jgi:site-specific DNA recombinase
VQQTLRSHDVAGVRQRRHEHYLKGLLHCGDCGRRLSLTLTKGTYLYFYCLGQRGTARTGCRQPYVLAADAEALVEELYRRIELPPSWVDRLTEELEAEIIERQAEASERRVVLTRSRQARRRARKAAAGVLRERDRARAPEGRARPDRDS